MREWGFEGGKKEDGKERDMSGFLGIWEGGGDGWGGGRVWGVGEVGEEGGRGLGGGNGKERMKVGLGEGEKCSGVVETSRGGRVKGVVWIDGWMVESCSLVWDAGYSCCRMGIG